MNMEEIFSVQDKQVAYPVTKNELNVAAKVATATAMASATTFCLERRFLHNLQNSEYFKAIIEREGCNDFDSIKWISIEQIGRPCNGDFRSCFAALQNILMACYVPQTRLLFLVTGNDGKYSMFLGINHDLDMRIDDAEILVDEISSFCNASWPGMQTHVMDVESVKNTIHPYLNNKRGSIHAVTGIPSLDLNDTNYPSTIEYLLRGDNAKGTMAYLVVAEPIKESEVESINYAIDEIRGQAESMKTINMTVAQSDGTSESFAKTLTESMGKTTNDSTSRKNIAGTLAVIGVGMAVAGTALAFPPAIGVVAAAGGSAAGGSAAAAMLGTAASGTLSSLVAQKTHGVSIQENESHATTNTTSRNFNYTETLGQTYVNGHIDSIVNSLKLQSERFGMGQAQGMWNVGCYLFTDDENISSHIQLKSLLCGKNSRLEPIRTHKISHIGGKNIEPFILPPKISICSKLCNKGSYQASVFSHPFGTNFSQLTTFLTTEELTSMINFPLHSVPGVSVIDCPPEFRLDIDTSNIKNPLLLGNLLHRGKEVDIKAMFDIDTLVRHSLVCGTNGSGKTNTVLGILNEVQKHGRNFMVIEPAKTEYVDWAIGFNEKLEQDHKVGKRLEESPITIYMPGRKHYWHTDANGKNKKYDLEDVLKINPFEPVALDGEEPNVQSHLDRIKNIFSLAFPMEDILPTVMETLLTDAYTNGEQWLNRRSDTPKPELYPTLSLLRCRSTNVIKGLGYEPRVTANIAAAINLRLTNLLSSWKRELFNNEVLGGYKNLSKEEIAQGIKRPTWVDFFNRRVVVNLSGIADNNDRVFVMGLLLLYLYEYRVATSQSPGFSYNDETLRHLMVIEEAHRVMTKSADPNSPQFKCGALFSEILSEIRAYGQGIMVVDQIPIRLIEDATKNTNMKIVHRLIAADDIESVSNSMGVNEDQKRIFPRLSVGQAVIAGLNASKSDSTGGEDVYWVKIKKNK